MAKRPGLGTYDICVSLKSCTHRECTDCGVGHGFIPVGPDDLCDSCREVRFKYPQRQEVVTAKKRRLVTL